jgi:hypothetical protein
MAEPIDWGLRDLHHGWARLASAGFPGAQDVVDAHGIPPYRGTPPVIPAPRVSAPVPQAPRAATPTVASSGLQRRIDSYTRLVNPPAPPTDF